jgi:hypothetical protein
MDSRVGQPAGAKREKDLCTPHRTKGVLCSSIVHRRLSHLAAFVLTGSIGAIGRSGGRFRLARAHCWFHTLRGSCKRVTLVARLGR